MPEPDEPVWVLTLFDFPVKTKQQVREATRYREYLLQLGHVRVQYSVYAKYVINRDSVQWLARMIERGMPSEGEVRVLCVTDREWASMLRFVRKIRVEPEKAPEQLTIFDRQTDPEDEG
jgi:CRISPR-associated protein Cas2